VVTGSASGLGAAVAARLRAAGHEVTGVDRRDAEVVADLGTPEGRAGALAALSASPGPLDGLVVCAGLSPAEDPRAIVRVNYFGAVALLDALRDRLALAPAAAAVAIGSVAAVFDALALPALLEACHADDEPTALELAAGLDGTRAYCNAKRALCQAVRRRAADFGARGVRLNAVAPGKMATPMLDALLASPAQRAALDALAVPQGRVGTADEIAAIVVLLLGDALRYVHGQVLYVDGGAEAAIRPDAI
jgi:NAD(P)-dependent dehydrogenase (short-subunit alcohol dehydrogenase family)